MPSCTTRLRTPPSSAVSAAISANSLARGARALALDISADGGAFYRDRHQEHGTARLVRDDAHAAVVAVDQALDDRQAQPRAARLTRAARVDLIKGVEHATALALGNADAGVGNADLD